MLRNLFTRAAFTALATLLLATPPRTGHAGGLGCAGDCDGTGQVTVDELTTLVSIALGNAQRSACGDGAGSDVDITFIIQAVGYALNSCRVLDCNDFRTTCSFDLSRVPAATFATASTALFPKWAFLTNSLGTPDAPLALTVENGSLAPGAAVTLEPLGTTPRAQLWKSAPTGDGEHATLWSALGNQIALSLDVSQSTLPAVTDPSQISADSIVPHTSLFQRWNYDSQTKSIGNAATGGQLCAYAVGAGVALSDTCGPGSQWSMSPSYPLDTALAQSQAFATGTTSQAAAYNYINQQIGLAASTCTLMGKSGPGQPMTGIRCQYANLAANLSDYKSTIDNLDYPSGMSFSEDDFNAVRSRLDIEITYADNVRNLYENAASFIGDVFLDDGATLMQALLPPNYTITRTVGLTANTLPSGSSEASYAEQYSTQSNTDPLWYVYGKLQAVSGLITSTGPASLAWPPTSAGLLRYAVQGYTVSPPSYPPANEAEP